MKILQQECMLVGAVRVSSLGIVLAGDDFCGQEESLISHSTSRSHKLVSCDWI
jgi:hypothetical protein